MNISNQLPSFLDMLFNVFLGGKATGGKRGKQGKASTQNNAQNFYNGAMQPPAQTAKAQNASLDPTSGNSNLDNLVDEIATAFVQAIEAALKNGEALPGTGNSSTQAPYFPSGSGGGGGGGNRVSSGGGGGGGGGGGTNAARNNGGTQQPSAPSTASPGTTGAAGITPTTTRQGNYSVAQCKQDIINLAKSQGKAPPSEPMLSTIANGIMQGIHDDFTGKNSIGDFSKIPASVTGKMLVSMAYQESNFGRNGEDAGGILQTAPVRLQQYNAAHHTNISEGQMASDPQLAMSVGCWCISSVEGTLGRQAGNVPIPSSLPMQMAYYWNYNPVSDHGHANELMDYMSEMQKYMAALGVNGNEFTR